MAEILTKVEVKEKLKISFKVLDAMLEGGYLLAQKRHRFNERTKEPVMNGEKQAYDWLIPAEQDFDAAIQRYVDRPGGRSAGKFKRTASPQLPLHPASLPPAPQTASAPVIDRATRILVLRQLLAEQEGQ